MLKMVIAKVRDSFISDDCIQANVSFTDALEIKELESGEILFSLDNQKYGYQNKYLDDTRREKFPYHNIPVCRTIRNLKIYNVVNQILEYGKVYKAIFREDRNTYSIFFKVVRPTNGKENNMRRAGAFIVTTAEQIPELNLSYEQLESLIAMNQVKVIVPKTIKVSRLLNRNIKKEDIEEAKRLAKTMKNK